MNTIEHTDMAIGKRMHNRICVIDAIIWNKGYAFRIVTLFSNFLFESIKNTLTGFSCLCFHNTVLSHDFIVNVHSAVVCAKCQVV